jgi:hypothetical protein
MTLGRATGVILNEISIDITQRVYNGGCCITLNKLINRPISAFV